MSKASNLISILNESVEELPFNYKNFIKVLKAGKGIVVFGTGGGYSDTVEFKVKDNDYANDERHFIRDKLWASAANAVAGAKDPKMKGRKFKVRTND